MWGLPLLFPESIQSYRIVIYGILLIVILALKPEGAVTKKTIRWITGLFRKKSSGITAEG